MIILRSILLIIITLLFLVVATGMIRSIDPNQSNILMLIFLAMLIVVLGPLWPSKEKIEKSKVKLLTDNPAIAYPLFALCMSLLSVYFAINTWLSPSHSNSRITKMIYSLFGNNGVILFWLILGFLCFIGALNGYKKSKSA